METFLDEIIRECADKPEFASYLGLHFVLELAGGQEEEIVTGTGADGESEVTNIHFVTVQS